MHFIRTKSIHLWHVFLRWIIQAHRATTSLHTLPCRLEFGLFCIKPTAVSSVCLQALIGFLGRSRQNIVIECRYTVWHHVHHQPPPPSAQGNSFRRFGDWKSKAADQVSIKIASPLSTTTSGHWLEKFTFAKGRPLYRAIPGRSFAMSSEAIIGG